MRLTVDKENDMLYFRLDDETLVVESEEVAPGVILDYDQSGRLVGVEILSLSSRVAPDKLRLMQFETV